MAFQSLPSAGHAAGEFVGLYALIAMLLGVTFAIWLA